MFKRSIARLLIALQVYSGLYSSLQASFYDEMPGSYKLTISQCEAVGLGVDGIGTSSLSPRFKLSIPETDSDHPEIVLEDFSLTEAISNPAYIPEKELTSTPEGVILDVDGLRFITTADGCLIIRGIVDKTRKWAIQSAASVILDGLDADNFDITSPLVLTRGDSSVRSMRVHGTGKTSQWVNQGFFKAQETFISGLWMSNEGNTEIGLVKAEQAFGIDNTGVFHAEILKGGQASLHNRTGATLDVIQTSVDGNVINAGDFKGTMLITSDQTSIENKGQIELGAWHGDLAKMRSEGSVLVGRSNLVVESMYNTGLMCLESVMPTDIADDEMDVHQLQVRHLENYGNASFGAVTVADQFINAGKASVKSVKGEKTATFTNTRQGTLKSEEPMMMLDIGAVDNDGDIETAGEVRVAGKLTNNKQIQARELSMQSGSLVQNGDIYAERVVIEPGVGFATSKEQEMQLDRLEIWGEGTVVLDGKTKIKHLLSSRAITSKGKVTAKYSADIEELWVPAKGDFFTESLWVEGDLIVGGKAYAKARSYVKGDIITEKTGRLGLERFSAPTQSKSMHNSGRSVISFAPEYAAMADKGMWTVTNVGALTLDQKSAFTPTRDYVTLPDALGIAPFFVSEPPSAQESPLAMIDMSNVLNDPRVSRFTGLGLKQAYVKQYNDNHPDAPIDVSHPFIVNKQGLGLKEAFAREYNAALKAQRPNIDPEFEKANLTASRLKASSYKQQSMGLPASGMDPEFEKANLTTAKLKGTEYKYAAFDAGDLIIAVPQEVVAVVLAEPLEERQTREFILQRYQAQLEHQRQEEALEEIRQKEEKIRKKAQQAAEREEQLRRRDIQVQGVAERKIPMSGPLKGGPSESEIAKLTHNQLHVHLTRLEKLLGIPESDKATISMNKAGVLLEQYGKKYRAKYLAEHPEIIEAAERSVPEIAATAPVLNTEFTKEFEGMNPAQLRASAIRYKKLNGLSEDYSEFNGKNPAQLRALAINYKEAYQDVLSYAAEGRPIVAEGAERPFSSFERNPKHARLEGVSDDARKRLLNEELHERDRLLGLPQQREQHPEAQGLQPVPLNRIVNAALHYNDYLRALSPEAMGRLQHQELEKIRIKQEQELERVRLQQERELDERNRLEAAVAEMNSLPRVGMDYDVMKTARSTNEARDFANRALRERDRFLGLPAQGGFDHPELKVTKNPQEARNLGNQALKYLDHLKKTSLKKQALPISFTNEALGRIRLANGNFRLVSSVNKANGVVEVEKASLWKEGGTNNGLFDLKLSGEYDLFPGQGQLFGTVFSDSPVVMHAEAGTNVSNMLKFSPIQAPLLTIKKVGDWAITEDMVLPSPLRLDLTGNLLPSAFLKAPTIDVHAQNLQTSVGGGKKAGMLISTAGLLNIILRERLSTPVGLLFGKKGMKITAAGMDHGSRYEKAEGAPGYKYLANPSDIQTEEGGIDITLTSGLNNTHGRIISAGRLKVQAPEVINVAGEMYGYGGGKITANKLVVKREEPLTTTSGGGAYTTSRKILVDFGWGQVRQVTETSTHYHPTVTNHSEQSEESILRFDGNLEVDVNEIEVDGSQITAIGDIWFKRTGAWSTAFDSTTASAADKVAIGLRVTPGKGKDAPAIVRAGEHLRAQLSDANLKMNGRMLAQSIYLSAKDILIQSVCRSEGKERASQLIDLMDLVEREVASRNPRLRNMGTQDQPLIMDVASRKLAEEGFGIPFLDPAKRSLPRNLNFGFDLPVAENLMRNLMMRMGLDVLGTGGKLTLKTLANNMSRLLSDESVAVEEEEDAIMATGGLVPFRRAAMTPEGVMAKNPNFALLFATYQRTEADEKAAERIRNADVIDADLTSQSANLMLYIPGQRAATSTTELFSSNGDTELEAETIDAIRGSTIVETGDAVKGTRDTVFMDEVLIHAAGGQVIMNAQKGRLDRVYPTADKGVVFAPGLVQKDSPEIHEEWDHTEEVRQQQEAAMFGGMGGGFGGFPGFGTQEMAGFNLSFGGGGMHASGFGGNNTRDWRSIQNPISRSMARKWEESQSIGRAYQAQFNGMLGPVDGPDIRARVFGSIPTANAISERIQEQTFHMQQEHAWNQFERELEEALTESYEGDDGSVSNATISTTALEEKALAKQISNTAKALENAVIRKARSKSTGDKSALIDGLWDVESYRAKQELEATISNMSLSAKVRMGAEIALELATEGMMTLHGEMKARPVHTAGRAVATGIEMGVPLGDAALKTSSGIVEACRGEFGASGSLFVAALTSAGLDLTAAGLMKKAVVGSAAITKAARGVGRAFQEKYVQKMLSRMDAAPYNPRSMEALLKGKYGVNTVTSSTLPKLSMPNVKMAGKELIMPGSGARVVFDGRGYPILDDI